MSDTEKHRGHTTKNNQWTYRGMARWVIAWYATLTAIRGIWFGITLGAILLVLYSANSIRLPFSLEDRQNLIAVWIAAIITLALCAGPTVWLMGLGKKHVVREPLRGAIWIVRGLNAAFLTYFTGLMLVLVNEFDLAAGDWTQIPVANYALALVAAICLWLIPFALAKPLALKPFRDLAYCVDSIYRQSSGKASHFYIVRLMAQGGLEAEKIDGSDEYRVTKRADPQNADRGMKEVWATIAAAVIVLLICLLVSKSVIDARAADKPLFPDIENSAIPDTTNPTDHLALQPNTEERRDLSKALKVAEARLVEQQEQARIAHSEAAERQRQIDMQTLLVQEIQRREAARLQAQADQAAADALRIRRWWIDWDNRGRGTLVIQMANHGLHSIHINRASIQQGRWTYVAQYVPAGSTLTHRIAVNQEPIYVDLETSVGTLRFDLVPDR
ncbi:MAG: hypothetical protein AAGB26_15045 [Planctomycetota bacterium]